MDNLPVAKTTDDDSTRWTSLRRLAQQVPGAKSRSLVHSSALLVLIAGVVALALRLSDYLQVLFLKSFAVVVLSYLPGWLFLRFVSLRAQSVRDEYVLNLHRLGIDQPWFLPEPPVDSIYHEQWAQAPAVVRRRQCAGDLEAARTHQHPESNFYLDKFEAHYGRVKPVQGRCDNLRSETFFPVVLSTAIFSVGWAAVLQEGSPAAMVPSATSSDLLRLAFLGAYLFTLQMLLRRFFQSDLKASAYVNAVVRVVSALVLIAVLDLTVLHGQPTDHRVAVAFVIGFFPLVGLQALQKLAGLALRSAVPSLRNDYPLSDLDGLSVWYEARLLELGIEDMENLATANMVDVTLHSRVPVARLVDWVDQAHLYLHLNPRESRRRERGRESDRRKLRRLGIRTATDLEAAFGPSEAQGNGVAGLSDEDNGELLEGLRWALNPGTERVGPSVTQSLLKTFRNDPNLVHVRAWKRRWTERDLAPTNGSRSRRPSTAGARNGSRPTTTAVSVAIT